MSTQVLNGNDIKYSLVYVTMEDIKNLKILEQKHHEIVGYGLVDDNKYTFYSIVFAVMAIYLAQLSSDYNEDN